MNIKSFFIVFSVLTGLCFGTENLFSKYSKLYLYTITGLELECNSNPVLQEEIKSGIKVTLPFAEIKTNLKTESFTDLPQSYNYGLSVFSNKYSKKFPCTLSYGTLTPSGIYSKINTPQLSTSLSPFSTASTNMCELNGLLPGSNSFSNSQSIFCKLAYCDKKKILSQAGLQAIYFPESQEGIFSINTKLSPSKSIKLGFSSTAGLFDYEEYAFSSWFDDYKKYYHSGSHFCGNLQNSFQTKHFSSLFSLYSYETPFGQFNWVFQNENNVKINNSIISFSVLYNNNPTLLTIRKETINPSVQFSFGLQEKHKLNFEKPVFVKTGFKTYYKLNTNKSSADFKIGTGLQLSSLLTSAYLYGAVTTNYDLASAKLEINSVNLKLSNTFNLTKLTPGFSADYSFNSLTNSKLKTTQKYSLNFLLSQKLRFYNTNSFTFTTEGQNIQNWKQTSSLKLEYSTKYINTSLKLSTVFFRG